MYVHNRLPGLCQELPGSVLRSGNVSQVPIISNKREELDINFIKEPTCMIFVANDCCTQSWMSSVTPEIDDIELTEAHTRWEAIVSVPSTVGCISDAC